MTISKDNKAKTSGIGINTVALIDKKSPLSAKMLEDADTLNGHNSEYFLGKIEENTKQINILDADVLHFSGKRNEEISVTANYNEYINVGRYEGTFYTSNQTHAPFSVPQVTEAELIVRRMLNSTFMQEFNVFFGYGAGSSYKRFFNGTTWTPWLKKMTETDVQALIDAAMA